ncbi:hypothetical protein OK016_04345 [Vibrio chagasii]|nr:hypothetical protein [Vibrio chagasii]
MSILAWFMPGLGSHFIFGLKWAVPRLANLWLKLFARKEVCSATDFAFLLGLGTTIAELALTAV